MDPTRVEALLHMGAHQVDGGVNFAVYSERATRVELALFDDPEADLPTRRFLMHRLGDVWSTFLSGVGAGQHYGFIAWGPNWAYDPSFEPGGGVGFMSDVDAAGNRFNPNKLLFDPYARAFHRDHDHPRGSPGSAGARRQSTYGAAAKAVVTDSRYAWSAHEAAWRRHAPEDVILYEVHMKGFTMNSHVAHPGTYRGFAEQASYLRDLGITAVELMPVQEKSADGGYWGYQTLGFFAPEVTYASDPRWDRILDEFKSMVDTLHQHGIEVILDVVYNHTGEGGLWRSQTFMDDTFGDPEIWDNPDAVSLYGMRGLDNHAYYALSDDKQSYWNDTGVGNQTRCDHRPMRRLILDSLRYFVEEMHVDGFRFDLAPILGTVDRQWVDPKTTLLQEIIEDPVLSEVRIIAEPWSLAGAYNGQFPATEHAGWYEWNGRFRDFWRALANDETWRLNSREGPADAGYLLTGMREDFEWNGRKPYHAVNFVSVHDGFTLYDVFSYEQKQNGCGPLNPVCCDDPGRPFCESDSGESYNRSRAWSDEAFKRQQMRNLLTLTLLSHGTPMLLGGDEWRRTQFGNNNAYSSGADNVANWFAWGEWQADPDRVGLQKFVRGLIALRKEFKALVAPTEYRGGYAWRTPANTDMQAEDWSHKELAMHYFEGRQLLLCINMNAHAVSFTLPPGPAWLRRLDTQGYFEQAGNLFAADPVGESYEVAPYSVVVLADE
jgi:glycogen operon protein